MQALIVQCLASNIWAAVEEARLSAWISLFAFFHSPHELL